MGMPNFPLPSEGTIAEVGGELTAVWQDGRNLPNGARTFTPPASAVREVDKKREAGGKKPEAGDKVRR